MKRILAIYAFVLCSTAMFSLKAQSVVRLGKTTIELQSPILIQKDGDSLHVEPQIVVEGRKPVWMTRKYTELYLGSAFPVRTERSSLSINYGTSYCIDAGVRQVWRIARNYGFGLSVTYTFYNYSTCGLAESGSIMAVPENYIVKKQFIRSDNLSLGIFNRIYFKSYGTKIYLDFGCYGELAASSRFKTVAFCCGNKYKDKFRDGNLFYPLQGGVRAELGFGDLALTCRYRLSNIFNPDRFIQEPDRLAVGLSIAFL